MTLCRICKEHEATKKNSHQLPSFLAVMVSSDGSYKRDKEMMFTFDKYKTEVYAHGLSSTKWESTFDNLTEQRIQQISNNPVSEDYVFCPQCEKMLADYLETPYSAFFRSNTKIQPDIPLMFWISVIWRLSMQRNHGFTLGKNLNEFLRENINKYLQHKNNKEDISDLIGKLNISYRIVCCKDYCRTRAGFIHCRYDNVNKFFSLIVGDICVCMNLDGEYVPSTFSLYGFENYIKDAPVNKGIDVEKKIDISTENYKNIISQFVKDAAKTRLIGLLEIADKLWIERGLFLTMPMRKKMAFAEKVVAADAKIGDKYSPQIYIDAFNEVVKNPLL